jgi:hypothetical protein
MRYAVFSRKRVWRPSHGGVAIISIMKETQIDPTKLKKNQSWRYKSHVTSMNRHDSCVIHGIVMAVNFLIKFVIYLVTLPVTKSIQPRMTRG